MRGNAEHSQHNIVFENEAPKTVILASESARRIDALRQLRHLEVVPQAGGDEDNTLRADEIARAKIEHVLTFTELAQVAFAFPEFMEQEQVQHGPRVEAIVAADVQTLIPRFEADGRIIQETQGKPETFEKVKENFQHLLRIAQEKGYVYYVVASGSAFQNGEGTIGGVETTKVFLNQEKLEWLTTEEGFAAYCHAVEVLEDLSVMFAEGMATGVKKSVTPLTLSGGFSLSAFTHLGVVEGIGEVQFAEAEQEAKEEAFRETLFKAGAGYSREVLARVHEHAYEYILRNWLWLQQATEKTFAPYQEAQA